MSQHVNIRDSAAKVICRMSAKISNSSSVAKLSSELLRVQRDVLLDAWKKFNAAHEEVLAVTGSAALDEQLDVVEPVEAVFVETLSNYNILLDERKASMVSKPVTSDCEQQSTSFHGPQLPKINLPTFSGGYVEWQSFSDLFTALVDHRKDISAIEKFQHLKTSVTGEAERLISHIVLTGDNYILAWRTLTDRYTNVRVVTNTLMHRLFNQPSTNEGAEAIKALHDVTTQTLELLSNLGRDTDHWDDCIVYLVTQRLGPITRSLWESKMSTINTPPTWKQLQEFLLGRFRMLEATSNDPELLQSSHSSTTFARSTSASGATSGSTKHINKFKVSNNANQKHFNIMHTRANESVSSSKCDICKDQHRHSKCKLFINMSVDQRRKMALHHEWCLNCLRSDHNTESCGSTFSCTVCGQRHHTLLHNAPPAHGRAVHTLRHERAIKAFKDDSTVNANHRASCTLLPTAQVDIKSPAGTIMRLRALIDSGSEVSIITKRMVQLLQLPCEPSSMVLSAVGHQAVSTRGVSSIYLNSIYESKKLMVKPFILGTIADMMPSCELPHDDSNTTNMQLADPAWFNPGPVDILLGAELHSDVIINGSMKLTNGLLAQNSIFGWLLSGLINSNNAYTRASPPAVHQVDAYIHHFRHIWDHSESSSSLIVNASSTSIDKGARSTSPSSEPSSDIEQHFLNTHQRLTNGRYQVRIPIHPSRRTSELGNSLRAATNRLHQVERRLSNQQTLKSEYIKFMAEYLNLGHMEEITADHIVRQDNVINYLPHHAVVKPDSTSTKVRVVFDASCSTSTGVALNHIMQAGPTLQDDLTTILMRWRQHRYAFCADVEKMYRQILIHPDDQDLQRIIWRDSVTEPIRHFRLKTVTYGTSSAPFLAVKVLQQLAMDESSRYPLGSTAAMNDFYVDDVMSGANDIDTATDIQIQLSKLLKSGGLILRKWASNCDSVLHRIPPSDRQQTSSRSLDANDNVHALGLRWDPELDELKFNIVITPQPTHRLTKRQLLSEASRLFDPMGLLTPATLWPKLIFQKIWLLNLNWDQEIPVDIHHQWLRFRSELPSLADLRIPRWTNFIKGTRTEFHGFSDASLSAYSAVIYLKTIYNSGDTSVTLLRAKSRVASLNRPTLPRLELCGVALLADLLQDTVKAMKINYESPIHVWCDSTIVLCWLQAAPSKWKPFISNRTSAIKSKLPTAEFHHIRSKDNPADPASRGLYPKQLLKSELWWHGPSWLSNNQFPTETPIVDNDPDALTEIRASALIHNISTTTLSWSPIDKFSSINKMQNVTAWCMRFISNLRLPKTQRNLHVLSSVESKQAFAFCVKQVQEINFVNELHQLRKSNSIPSSSQLSSLSPFIDKEGVLRVGGRLRWSALPYDTRHPMILPKDHVFTDKIIRDAHLKTMHGGLQLTLSYLRQQYFITNIRRQVKRQLRNCIRCTRQHARTHHQIMADLPSPRVNPSKPFAHTIVDYAGPVSTRESRSRGRKVIHKSYIAVFACLSTKAVHLEAVTDLTSDAFIAAFHRFLSRRGHCTDLYSDCGRNFVGANHTIQEFNDLIDGSSPELLRLKVNWHFSPPAAPHFNGLAESNVKSMKNHLRKTIGNEILTFEELSTILTRIEACLNSRPLGICPSDDVVEETILTPGHFLVGSALLSNTEIQPLDTTSLARRWRHLYRLTAEFWRIWSTQYLVELQHRRKWKSSAPDLAIGDIVLLKEDNSPPLHWPMARIETIHPGRDGRVRAVTIKTEKGSYDRPIVKIVRLPIITEDQSRMANILAGPPQNVDGQHQERTTDVGQ